MNCASTENCTEMQYNNFSSGVVDEHEDDWDDDTQGGADCDTLET